MAKDKEAVKASTLKVKILVSIGGEINFKVNDVVEVEASLAEQLINAGYAEKA